MAQRITVANLHGTISALNRTVNGSADAVIKCDGRVRFIAGMFGLDNAYGGYKLVRYTEDGGESSISQGYVSARELYNFIWAYRDGYELRDRMVRDAAVEEARRQHISECGWTDDSNNE
jgi:hypothetical protein